MKRLVLMGLLFASCGDTRARCATVICNGVRVCEESTGACRPVECVKDLNCHCPSRSCTAQNTCTTADLTVANGGGGEACLDATALLLCEGTLSFNVDLSSKADDLEESCGVAGSGGKDATFSIVLDATQDVRVTARPSPGTGTSVVLSLRSSCDSSHEVACATLAQGAASFHSRSLRAGAYLLIVDSANAPSAGPVDVTVEILPPTQPANETCGTAATLPMDGTPQQVDLKGASDDVRLSCDSKSASPDVFYRFNLSATSDVVVTATAAPDSGVDPVLALLPAPCLNAAAVSCVNTSRLTETLREQGLAAGTWYVVVKSWGAHAGPVVVTGTATAPNALPSNATCTAAQDIAFDGGTAAFVADTSWAADSVSGSCNSTPDSPELVYSLSLTDAQTVSVTATPLTGGEAVIYLQGTSCDSFDELACSHQYLSDQFSVSLGAGTYWLFVEGYGRDGAGPTQVTVTLGPPG